ncbi:MAG: helix-turn-helix domain-containing protein [Dehalococcoidia bacterium]
MTEFLTEQEAAERLMVTRENLRRMIWSGRVDGEPTDPTKRSYRVSARSIERLLTEGGYVPGVSQPSE